MIEGQLSIHYPNCVIGMEDYFIIATSHNFYKINNLGEMSSMDLSSTIQFNSTESFGIDMENNVNYINLYPSSAPFGLASSHIFNIFENNHFHIGNKYPSQCKLKFDDFYRVNELVCFTKNNNEILTCAPHSIIKQYKQNDKCNFHIFNIKKEKLISYNLPFLSRKKSFAITKNEMIAFATNGINYCIFDLEES